MSTDQIRLSLNLPEVHSFSFKFEGRLSVSMRNKWKRNNSKVSRNLIFNGALTTWQFKKIKQQIVGIQRVRKAHEIEE